MGGFMKISRYLIVRAIILFCTVVVAVYITVFIANMGGHMDQIRRDQIKFDVAQAVYADPGNMGVPTAELQRMINERAEMQYRRLGLDQPFIVRSVGYLTTALSLNLGRSEYLTSDTGSREVRRVITERLMPTLLLLGTAVILVFIVAVFVALALSRRYGSFVDRAVIALAPTSSAPGWFYGIFLILLFAAVLRVMPYGGMVQSPPPKEPLAYALSLLRHLALPVSAIFLGGVFGGIYSWRTFFLIYSSEDYVELARAKGLSSRRIQNRYILRPTLPTIITQFMLTIITLWMGAIVLETVFNWPGLGRLYLTAVNLSDTPIIVGTVVIYGYLLAGTVLLLDFIYAIVDPRIRVGKGGGSR